MVARSVIFLSIDVWWLFCYNLQINKKAGDQRYQNIYFYDLSNYIVYGIFLDASGSTSVINILNYCVLVIKPALCYNF